MAIKVDDLEIRVLNLITKEPYENTKFGREIEESVLDDLEMGEYCLDISEKHIVNLYDQPLYSFEIINTLLW